MCRPTWSTRSRSTATELIETARRAGRRGRWRSTWRATSRTSTPSRSASARAPSSSTSSRPTAARRSRTRACSSCSMRWSTTCRARPRSQPQPEVDLEGNETGKFAIVDPNEPLRALAFKIMDDQYGALTFTRIYSGKLEKGTTLLNTFTGKTERVGPHRGDARRLPRGGRCRAGRRHRRAASA